MTHFLDKLPFATHAWFMYLRLLVQHFLDDNCTQKAASLTYTTLLSIVPIIAVVLMIFSTVPALEGVREQVQQAIYSNLLPSSSSQISNYLYNFAEKSIKMSIVGVGALLFTTIMTLITIETAFNQIWRVEDKPDTIKSVVRFLIMVVAVPSVLGIAFLASSAVQSIDFLNRRVGGYGIDWGVWVQIFSFFITILGFAGMYWFIPKIKVPLKNAVIAGGVIAVIFECVKQVFGLAITNFTSYEAIYGAFAALPIFLMWIYISWNLILLGVEISYTLTIFETKETPVRHSLFSLMDMLNTIYKNFKNNKSTSEKELREVLGKKEVSKWQTYIAQLEQNKLITKLDNEEYTLKTDLNTINLWEFYKALPYSLPIKNELILLQEADYDPWYIELYDRLNAVEKNAKTELNTPLAYLFDTAPLRPKQETTQPSTTRKNHKDTPSHQTDLHNNSNKIQGNGSDILPTDTTTLTEGKASQLSYHLRAARHLFGKGKSLVNDIKRHFKR